MDNKDSLEAIIRRIYPLPKDSMMKFIALVEEHDYPKGHILYRQHEQASKIYIVKRGLVRAYAYRGKKPITFWFGQAGDFAFPIKSVFDGGKEYASIDLLEPSEVYEIEIEHLLGLYQTDIHIANWGRRYAELACITAENLLIDQQFKTTSERYQELLINHPDIILRVPMGIIASYLGTTQVIFGEIKRDMPQGMNACPPTSTCR